MYTDVKFSDYHHSNNFYGQCFCEDKRKYICSSNTNIKKYHLKCILYVSQLQEIQNANKKVYIKLFSTQKAVHFNNVRPLQICINE